MHPVLGEIKREIQALDEEVTLLSTLVSDGERGDNLKETLRANLRRAKEVKKDVERYLRERWAGAEDWMITKLNVIITVCDISLADFKKGPTSFQVDLAD